MLCWVVFLNSNLCLLAPRIALAVTPTSRILAIPRSRSKPFEMTPLADPHHLTPLKSYPYAKTPRASPHASALTTLLQSSVDSSKVRMLQVLCFQTLPKRPGWGAVLPIPGTLRVSAPSASLGCVFTCLHRSQSPSHQTSLRVSS